jgi:predicted transcriptional regulator
VEFRSSIFGTPLRDQILTILAVQGQSHVGELSRALGMSVAGVAKSVRQLERDGMIAAIAHGRTRILQLNSRWYAKTELRHLLERMAEANPDLHAPMWSVRSRPRRSGKPV